MAQVDQRTLLVEARARLEWLREDYGEEDIDLLTFTPIVELADRYFGLLDALEEWAKLGGSSYLRTLVSDHRTWRLET